MNIQILRNGVDSLYIAFRGALSANTLAALAAAKERALETGDDLPVEIMGIDGTIAPNGGGKSGYSYLFNTGIDGELWKIKKNDDPEQWNLFVEVSSLGLALKGYEAVKASLFETLETWGGRVIEESINRIDWAVDLVAPDFQLSAENFVNHSHCGVSDFSKGEQEEENTGSGFRVDYRNRKVKTVTVGKMPNRQVQVYDKRQEQIYKVNSPWFAIWGFDRADCPIVWRVELRAGKQYLKREPEQKKAWDIRTFADLEAAFGVMFETAMQQVRIIANGDYENISRAPDHAIWAAVRVELESALVGMVKGEITERVRTESRAQMTKMLSKQALGVAVSWSVASGHDLSEAAREFGSALDMEWRKYAYGEAFAKKYQAAAERLKFLNSEGSYDNANGSNNQRSGAAGQECAVIHERAGSGPGLGTGRGNHDGCYQPA